LSAGVYASLNLAEHVGDQASVVQQNRARLRVLAGLPAEPVWLNQVHGVRVCVAGGVTGRATGVTNGGSPEADAAVSVQPGVVCAVLTADCLPILMTDRAGTVVAAVHAGWRGLAAGVIEAAVAGMERPGAELMAWIGPGIGPQHFEVGDEVRSCFCDIRAEAASAFAPTRAGRWLADLPALARERLRGLGLLQVSGGELCTYADAHRFFSYRRDGVTGRMASLIWLEPDAERGAAAVR
jgi:YfiH family protein